MDQHDRSSLAEAQKDYSPKLRFQACKVQFNDNLRLYSLVDETGYNTNRNTFLLTDFGDVAEVKGMLSAVEDNWC